MISLLYLVAAVAHAGVWIAGARGWARAGRPAAAALVLLPAALLWYENLRTGLGRFVGPGELLYALSVPALAWHWTVLPVFVLAGYAVAHEAGLAWTRRPLALVTLSMVVTVMFAIDLPYALGLLFGPIGPLPEVELRLGCIGDAMRYTATLSEAYLCSPGAEVHRVGPGPLVAIAMVVAVLVIGVAIWVQRRWPWLAVAAGVMFLAAGAGPALGAYAAPVANVGEIVLVAAMLASALRFAPRRPRTPSAA